MVTIIIASLIAIAIVVFILGVRTKDLPEPVAESPFRHLDERKAAIYENLRDLQFEYRVGKLSDEDYQATKRDLQRELAVVLAEVDRLRQELSLNGMTAPTGRKPAGFVCPSCGAEFKQSLKFCGECGKPMKAQRK